MTRLLPLKDVVVAATGARNPTTQPEAEFVYVDVAAVDNESKVVNGARRMKGAEAPSRARKAIATGDVLVSTVRPNLNAVALVPPNLDGQVASTGFCVLRARRESILPEYIFYFVRSSSFVGGLTKLVSGAMYPAVTDRQVLEQPIRVPSLAEQRRIVDLLARAEGIVRLRREAQAKARAIIPALFLDMFGDPATNPKGLRTAKIGEVLKVKSGDFLPAAKMDTTGKIPVYGGNGKNGTHAFAMFDEPKIVVGRVGAHCGNVHLTDGPAWITDNALYVSETSSLLQTPYLLQALRQANLNRYSSQVAQPLISGSRIYPVEILVPPIEGQAVFAERAGAVQSIVAQQAAALTKAEATFQALLSRAFSGGFTFAATAEEAAVA